MEQQIYLKNALDRPIVLIGMMGTGKSHIGSVLSAHLELEFFDSDRLVEKKAGYAVSEIFEIFGEKKFRQAEKNTILELLGKGPCVIATGGGAVTNEQVLIAIKDKALSIWLKADVQEIMARVEGRKTRPLLNTENPERVLLDLMEQRAPLYSQADIIFETKKNPVEESVENLIKALCTKRNEVNL